MRLILPLLLVSAHGLSFTTFLPSSRQLVCLSAKNKLSAAQIIARARKAAGVAVEGENENGPPELFTDEVYDNIQMSLTLLDKRLKKGVLTPEEFEQFLGATDSVLNDLRERSSGPSAAQVASPAPISPPSPPGAVLPLPPPPPPATPLPPVAVTHHNQALEESSEVSINEKFKWDLATDDDAFATPAIEGYGMATGTKSTYEIKGMHSMTPEDYRKALQDKVIKDQQDRRIKRAGVVGNRAAMSYLDELNQGQAPEEQKWKTDTTSDEYAAEMERRRRYDGVVRRAR